MGQQDAGHGPGAAQVGQQGAGQEEDRDLPQAVDGEAESLEELDLAPSSAISTWRNLTWLAELQSLASPARSSSSQKCRPMLPKQNPTMVDHVRKATVWGRERRRPTWGRGRGAGGAFRKTIFFQEFEIYKAIRRKKPSQRAQLFVFTGPG